jgi:hypothetical protein
MNTNSKEYAEWVANVWRLNDERNSKLKAVESKSILDKHDGILPDDLFILLEK